MTPLFFVFAFALTLIYFSVTDRIAGYITLLAVQGALLFFIAFLELGDFHVLNLLFVLLETVLVKSIAAPFFLHRVRRRNRITKTTQSALPSFVSLFMVTGGLGFSFYLGYKLRGGGIDAKYFAISCASIFTGFYIVIVHTKVLTHLVGYLVIENGIFLLSLAVGSEMPMAVNTGILLDIFATILILGIFVNKVGDTFRDTSVERLSELRN